MTKNGKCLLERLVVYCDDGFFWDTSAIHGKDKPAKTTGALNPLLKKLQELQPSEVVFSYNTQVSFGGEFATQTRTLLMDYELQGKAHAVKQADVFALKHGQIVSSSDAVFINKAEGVVDLAGEISE